ncbi:MAG: 1,4-alpha-glucan branching protein GlgB [Clostridia bacterium]|nr:1,4-alpha-glucan branching protein GlgB [Clostridia bacterium]
MTKVNYAIIHNNIDYAYTILGAHRVNKQQVEFSLYAPNAVAVYLIGDFNSWAEDATPLSRMDSGVWTTTVTAKHLQQYKYIIYTTSGAKLYKADPYAFYSQTRGGTNSIIFDSNYTFSDSAYINNRHEIYDKPINIYEVHLGSWCRQDNGVLNYRELADRLSDYVVDMGYTHIELMPLCEYPLDDSWGYQVTGYFSPTARYGNPDDLRYFVDTMHHNNIGVILDWVPAHFCKDAFGLYEFDGSCVYECSDDLMQEHRQWGTRVFDTSKGYVVSFLVSSALYWLREFHFDGLRVDAVASMLYLDYGRQNGQWRPNRYGGKENIDNINFIRRLSISAFAHNPSCLLIAEESTSYAGITMPVDCDGLGFNYKWNMGWMNDFLSYFSADFDKRKALHNKLTFPLMYAYSENYILPFSHDEVVYGKCSLINKMPGSYEQKFNGLRVMLALMYAFPGKKLSFMGNEIAQFNEWNFNSQIEWQLLDYPMHEHYRDYCRALNHFYITHEAFYRYDHAPVGFSWDKVDDNTGIVAFTRHGRTERIFCLFNTSLYERKDYVISLPDGQYQCIFSTNGVQYQFNAYSNRAIINIPPLCAMYYCYSPLDSTRARELDY